MNEALDANSHLVYKDILQILIYGIFRIDLK